MEPQHVVGDQVYDMFKNEILTMALTIPKSEDWSPHQASN